MEALPDDIRAFLQNQPFLELTEANKIKCTLNGHELPCKLAELQTFTSGKKFQRLSAGAEFNYSRFEPHLVPSTKQPNRLFCKLTIRHINRVPQHVLRHVNGKRFKKALAQYEECKKQGVAFVPPRLRQKKRPKNADDVMDGATQGGSKLKQDSGIWAPSDSDAEGGSDSGDSLSDLYPPTMFTLKKSEEQPDEDKDGFQTDHEDMEVSETALETQKRRKAQPAAFSKKFKKNRKRKGFKAVRKTKN